MKKQDKITTVRNLTDKIKEAKVIIGADYRGLTAAQINELRNQIKKTGGELLVVKNSLLKRALQEAKAIIQITDEVQITEPTAIAIGNNDEITPLKAITDYAKGIGKPSLKFGIIERRYFDKEDVEKLSLLPGKTELLKKLLQLLQWPQVRLLNDLINNQSKLLFILKSWKGKGVN